MILELFYILIPLFFIIIFISAAISGVNNRRKELLEFKKGSY